MVTTKLNLSMTEPSIRQIYAKQGDTGRVLDISLDQTPEDGTLRILRPDGVEVTSEAVTGGEVSESGETVTFDSLTEADVTELTVGIEPVQDLNGYDAPWVGGAGVNIIGDFALADTPSSGGEVSARRQSDGSTYVLSGTASQRRDVYLLPTGSYSMDEGDYYIYAPTGTGINNADPYFYISINDGTSTRYIGTGGSRSSAPFTIASGDVVRGIFVLVASGVNATGKVVTPMIVKGTTAPTSYSPYSNICPITGHDEVNVYVEPTYDESADPTATVSLGQTVYGGTLDMVSGVLTVDKGFATFDGSLDESWGVSTSSTNATIDIADMMSGNRMDGISNMYVNGVSNGQFRLGVNGNKRLYLVGITVSQGITTVADLRTFLSANNLQVVYPLDTPQTYQLTAQQIQTLLGTNNVWASSGDIVNITFTYGGLLSELPSEATSVVGKCYCDVEQNGVSSMPFTLNVKKNERQS